MNAPINGSTGISLKDLQAQMAAQAAMIEALQSKLALANQPRRLSFKITAKRTDEKTGKVTGSTGAISVYGLGRFPVTLYAGQWDRLFAAADDLRAFAKANASLLASKD